MTTNKYYIDRYGRLCEIIKVIWFEEKFILDGVHVNMFNALDSNCELWQLYEFSIVTNTAK